MFELLNIEKKKWKKERKKKREKKREKEKKNIYMKKKEKKIEVIVMGRFCPSLCVSMFVWFVNKDVKQLC